MPTATVSASEETFSALLAGTTGVAELIDSGESTDVDLPCRTGDADLWFAEKPADLERAKTLCGECPVRSACLEGALARGEPWGVWGGEIFERGAVVARKRPRGRPRKHSVPESRERSAA
ncbi:WhiB family redox-sensing transcriptional regulator [Prauserella isguenensis]|uniref:Transcriptional regulator WhiB n=1 Tax=Prauserella isguenensis TaxID=1470180 RepID=A0A839S6K6_9PSEU|nr:WhiB family transcriptional regulator [Prauserella isguenensis]MBB3053416.1 WhiB family redox-sensing transcriptional regulator [Prauserella isguenensis]